MNGPLPVSNVYILLQASRTTVELFPIWPKLNEYFPPNSAFFELAPIKKNLRLLTVEEHYYILTGEYQKRIADCKLTNILLHIV